MPKAPLVGSALRHASWASLELEALNPLIDRQFVVGQAVMVARLLLKRGAVVPLHQHVNEQVTCVLQGALRFAVDGREIVVREGEILAIPPNLPHQVEALADSITFDIFNPPRQDWIDKDDAYLR